MAYEKIQNGITFNTTEDLGDESVTFKSSIVNSSTEFETDINTNSCNVLNAFEPGSDEVIFRPMFYDSPAKFDAEMSSNYGKQVYELYSGTYIVTPKASSQTLETEQKVMSSNVIVKEIQTWNVSNEFGKTFIIGG